jgi:hypothetical protein
MMPNDNRYPGYNVLDKRRTPSWNEATRRVVDKRLAISREPRALPPDLYAILGAVCDRIVPQPTDRPPVPVPAYVDAKLADHQLDGYRYAGMPEQDEAWRRGLRALDDAANRHYQTKFVALSSEQRDDLLRNMQNGSLQSEALEGMSAKLFFSDRLLKDIVNAYYAHPTAWSEMGFGGPASPRGYVRLALDRHDPWEAAVAKPGAEDAARKENKHVV